MSPRLTVLGTCLLLALTPALHAQVSEQIEVSRIIIDARVWQESDGIIPTDLRPRDFKVRIDGKEAEVASVGWVYDVSGTEPAGLENPVPEALGGTDSGTDVATDADTVVADAETIDSMSPSVRGHTMIYFVQTDFGRTAPRVLGEMRVIADFNKFLETVGPKDRVALLTFASHLVLRLDFTGDHALILKAFQQVLRIEDVPPVLSGASPSLATLLDPEAMRGTATSEEALTLLARALSKIDGPKTLVLFGWGMFGKELSPQLARTGAELSAARVTVDAFNFGLGAQMRAGLVTLAADTGGFYSSTHGYAFERGIQSLKSALQGHYEIEVRNPIRSVAGRIHSIDLRSTRRGLRIDAKRNFIDH